MEKGVRVYKKWFFNNRTILIDMFNFQVWREESRSLNQVQLVIFFKCCKGQAGSMTVDLWPSMTFIVDDVRSKDSVVCPKTWKESVTLYIKETDITGSEFELNGAIGGNSQLLSLGYTSHQHIPDVMHRQSI